MQVEDHHARTGAPDQLERGFARLGHEDPGPGEQPGEQLPERPAGVGVVLHDEDRSHRRLRAGSAQPADASVTRPSQAGDQPVRRMVAITRCGWPQSAASRA
jgi:hypothetical protein